MQLTFRIKKPSALVYDYLTDMQKFASVHPLISKIQEIGHPKYLVHEFIKLGYFPVSFTYPVTIESHPVKNLIYMHAVIMKLTKIEMVYQLKSDGNDTVIEENITIISLLPVKSTLQRIFRKQHGLLFKNIEALQPG